MTGEVPAADPSQSRLALDGPTSIPVVQNKLVDIMSEDDTASDTEHGTINEEIQQAKNQDNHQDKAYIDQMENEVENNDLEEEENVDQKNKEERKNDKLVIKTGEIILVKHENLFYGSKIEKVLKSEDGEKAVYIHYQYWDSQFDELIGEKDWDCRFRPYSRSEDHTRIMFTKGKTKTIRKNVTPCLPKKAKATEEKAIMLDQPETALKIANLPTLCSILSTIEAIKHSFEEKAGDPTLRDIMEEAAEIYPKLKETDEDLQKLLFTKAIFDIEDVTRT